MYKNLGYSQFGVINRELWEERDEKKGGSSEEGDMIP